MSWVVGLDLRNPLAGPAQFAKWLFEHGGASTLVGVHVLEEPDGQSSAELVERATHVLQDSVAQAGAKDSFAELKLVQGSHVEDALSRACVEHETEGLIIGRRVGVDEQKLVRLGSVARRILRALPAPVIVVPPDLRPESLGAGPVLVAVTEDWDASWAAYELAARLAGGLGRDVVVAHVAAPSKSWNTPYLPPDVLAEQRQHQKARAESQLREWMNQRGISSTRLVVLQGTPLESILQCSGHLEVPLIVCGRSKSTALQRYFGGTTATDLAAYSRAPVAVAATP